jgi:peptidoglycan/LPS O-acetylase OafA/YrhL
MQKNNFDFLRFLFAFIVVLAHIYELTKNQNILPSWEHIDSFIPVAGFFIISGFLITNSYSRSKSLSDYFVKRAQRLLPGYLFVVVICSLLFAFISTLSVHDYFTSSSLYKYFAANSIFLNFLQPCLPGVFENNLMCAVDGSFWTIKVEVSFYLVLPLLCYFINRTNKKGFVLTVFYILTLVYNYLLYRYFQVHVNPGLYFTLSHQLPSLMPYFIAGMALHYYFDEIFHRKVFFVLIAIPVFLVEYYLDYQVLRPIALSIIVFYLSYGFKWFNNFGRFGDFSYGLYIFHFPVIQVFVYYNLFKNYNTVVAVTITILTSVALAILSWNFIEKRFLKRAVHLPNKPGISKRREPQKKVRS